MVDVGLAGDVAVCDVADVGQGMRTVVEGVTGGSLEMVLELDEPGEGLDTEVVWAVAQGMSAVVWDAADVERDMTEVLGGCLYTQPDAC